MKKLTVMLISFLAVSLFFFGCKMGPGPAASPEKSDGPHAVTENQKCHTCGMKVFEFKNWHTQIVYKDGTNDAFCAVKCLMAYYFNPENFTGRKKDDFNNFYAKDYYTQEWIDMKTMYYVTGSDVMSPMGKDLVPFKDKKSAETFMIDHKGQEVLPFDKITPERVNAMRMKKGKGM